MSSLCPVFFFQYYNIVHAFALTYRIHNNVWIHVNPCGDFCEEFMDACQFFRILDILDAEKVSKIWNQIHWIYKKFIKNFKFGHLPKNYSQNQGHSLKFFEGGILNFFMG